MLAGQIALVLAAAFAGAASYINFAERPARPVLDDKNLVAAWKRGGVAHVGLSAGARIRRRVNDTDATASALAIRRAIADMGDGRLVVDDPLANRVRSGRKQP